MPADVAAVGISRFVFTQTTVGPDGKARDCTVERNSGDARLGVYTCAVIMDRARFEAAKWVDGSSVYGVIRAPVTYAIDSWPSESEQLRAYPPDMALSVNRLSAGAGARVKVNLAIAADENGRVVGCIERPPFSSHARDKHFPELIDIAC